MINRDHQRSWLRRVLSAAPETVLALPFIIWLIFSAGIGVGVAFHGGISLGVSVFVTCAVVLPLLIYFIISLGLGD